MIRRIDLRGATSVDLGSAVPRADFDVEAAVQAACVAVVGGQSPDQAAEEAQKIVDEQIG